MIAQPPEVGSSVCREMRGRVMQMNHTRVSRSALHARAMPGFTIISLLACVLVMLAALPALARRIRVTRPVHVRMLAYVGAPPAGARPQFNWLVSLRGTHYELRVMKLTVLSGNVLPGDIDAAVGLYRVKFQLAGTQTAMRNLAATPPGQLVAVLGYVRIDRGARYLLLDTVKPVPSPTPTGRGSRTISRSTPQPAR